MTAPVWPGALPTPIDGLFDGSERIFWLYLLASAAVALPFVWQGGHDIAVRARAYWLGPDSRLDAAYFLIAWALRTALIVPLVVAVPTIAIWTLRGLSTLFDPPFLAWRFQNIILLFTATLFLTEDLSRYALHRMLHRSRWLWPFHRVHHAAEVLTPLLVYRIHPLESLAFALRHAVVAGTVTGGFIFLFGARLDIYTVFGENLFIVVLFALTANLRHSHVRLSYGRWLEHILISPAQHQIHHDRRHLNSNFGSCLAIWDRMFGTLKIAAQVPDTPVYGIGPRGARFRSLGALLFEPVRDVARMLRRT